MYAMPVQPRPNTIAAAHALGEGVDAGQCMTASGSTTIAATTWLPVAIASDGTCVRCRFM